MYNTKKDASNLKKYSELVNQFHELQKTVRSEQLQKTVINGLENIAYETFLNEEPDILEELESTDFFSPYAEIIKGNQDNILDILARAQGKFFKKILSTWFDSYKKASDEYTRLTIRQELMKRYKKRIGSVKIFNLLYQEYLKDNSENQKLKTLSELEASAGASFLVQNLIPTTGITLLVGEPKIGKSSLACEIAYAVVTGNLLLGEQVSKLGNVLVINSDETPQETAEKYLNRGFSEVPDFNNKLKFLNNFSLDQLDVLQKYITENKISLVVFDNLKTVTAGLRISENSAKFGDLLSNLSQLLAKNNCAGLIIHHANKTKKGSITSKIRGSSAITAASSANLFLEIKNNQLILTATGRNIPETIYKLTINPRDQWKNQGVYSVIHKSEIASQKLAAPQNTPEIAPHTPEIENDIPEIAPETPFIAPDTPAEEKNTSEVINSTVTPTNPTQPSPLSTTTLENIPESPLDQAEKKGQYHPKAEEIQAVKEIIERFPALTKEEIIKEAVKVAINEQVTEAVLQKLLKSQQLSIDLQIMKDNIPEERYSFANYNMFPDPFS